MVLRASEYNPNIVEGNLGSAEYKDDILRPGWRCFGSTGNGVFGAILIVLFLAI